MPAKYAGFWYPPGLRIAEKARKIAEQMEQEQGLGVPMYAAIDRVLDAEMDRRGLKLPKRPVKVRRGRPAPPISRAPEDAGGVP